jgi:hypothetical protein
MAAPGNAELQLGISSSRKADASVAGVFTFRMALFSFKRRKEIDVVDVQPELGVPRGPKMGAGCGVGRRCQTLL